MTSGYGRIKVRSLEFGSPAFRKLEDLRIEFADRLTIIAGHNGIGKSTIQGLVANTFGISKGRSEELFWRALLRQHRAHRLSRLVGSGDCAARPVCCADRGR